MAPGARGTRIKAKRERRVREGRRPVSDASFLPTQLIVPSYPLCLPGPNADMSLA